MASVQFHQVSYGLTQPLINIFPAPIVALRNPATTDHAQIGTMWINRSTNSAFLLTSIVNNSATWTNLISGSGSFSSLTVTPGPTSLTGAFTVLPGTGNAVSIGANATNHPTTIGSFTGASPLDLQAGTSGISLEVASTGPIDIGGLNAPGIISIGSTAMTANIQIGNSAVGQVINLGGAAHSGLQQIVIGDPAPGGGSDQVTIGSLNAASATTIQAGTIGILLDVAPTGTIIVGDSAMTGFLQIGNSLVGQPIAIGGASNTGAQTIVIGNDASGAGTNDIEIGSLANASGTVLQAGTAGITLTAPFVALPGPVYLYTGAGAPAGGLALHTGDLYINTTGATPTTRLYIAVSAGVWTSFTALA